jgi:hypothetical protein
MGAALTAPQEHIVARLAQGPATMRELSEAAGYDADDRRGHNLVTVTLERLSERGYGFHNMRPPGSHRGGYYVLMARPHEPAGVRHCIACGARLAADHAAEVTMCSPCERGAITGELAVLHPPSLPGLTVEAAS